jgi:hypothetical protein
MLKFIYYLIKLTPGYVGAVSFLQINVHKNAFANKAATCSWLKLTDVV